MINRSFLYKNGKKYRSILIVMILAFLVLGLTMCGGSTSEEEAPPPEEEAPAAEVEEEADEHQFFYTPSAGIADRISVAIDDTDSNGLPLGLEFTVTVTDGAAATGTMQVVLSHYDEGPKDGVNMSDESDVDVAFPIEIQ